MAPAGLVALWQPRPDKISHGIAVVLPGTSGAHPKVLFLGQIAQTAMTHDNSARTVVWVNKRVPFLSFLAEIHRWRGEGRDCS